MEIRYFNALTNRVNGGLSIFRRTGIVFALASLLLAGAALSGTLLSASSARQRSASMTAAGFAAVPRLPPPTIAQALESGVLIVISKTSQRMDVFKDGAPWLSSPVSTGRRGHSTPAGVFPILEKQRFHRSNIYSNAPMPFMLRLTRGGIAIHAGYVPGHPASHGCIRLPYGAARSLFGLTRASETTVVIMDEAIQSDDQARRLALAVPQPATGQPVPVVMAMAPAPLPNDSGRVALTMPFANAQPGPGAGQTIQLAAALSPRGADSRWNWLVSFHAELGKLDKTVAPVVVGSHRYFRLRASGPGAFANCSRLKGAGVDCFRVL